MVFCYGGLEQSDRRERKLILRETVVDSATLVKLENEYNNNTDGDMTRYQY